MKRAFVLRLTQEAQPVGGKFEGRVEEVDSGKSQRFASVEEFLFFLQSYLGDHKYRWCIGLGVEQCAHPGR